MANKRNGRVEVYCGDLASNNKIRGEIGKNIKEDHSVVVLKEIRPKLLICGMSEEWSGNDFLINCKSKINLNLKMMWNLLKAPNQKSL